MLQQKCGGRLGGAEFLPVASLPLQSCGSGAQLDLQRGGCPTPVWVLQWEFLAACSWSLRCCGRENELPDQLGYCLYALLPKSQSLGSRDKVIGEQKFVPKHHLSHICSQGTKRAQIFFSSLFVLLVSLSHLCVPLPFGKFSLIFVTRLLTC